MLLVHTTERWHGNVRLLHFRHGNFWGRHGHPTLGHQSIYWHRFPCRILPTHLSWHEMATLERGQKSRENSYPSLLDVLLFHLQLHRQLRRTIHNEIRNDCVEFDRVEVPHCRGLFHRRGQCPPFLVLLLCYKYAKLP